MTYYIEFTHNWPREAALRNIYQFIFIYLGLRYIVAGVLKYKEHFRDMTSVLPLQ